MRTHIQVVAILFLIIAGLFLLAAFFAPIVLGFLSALLVSSVGSGEHGAAAGAAVMGLVGAALTVVMLCCAIPPLVCGVGLLKFRRWARILGIILASIALIKIPFGTLFGIYALWVLFNKDSEAIFATPSV